MQENYAFMLILQYSYATVGIMLYKVYVDSWPLKQLYMIIQRQGKKIIA